MPIRIHELHPSFVHFPLALFPAALVADVAGRVSGNRWLMKLGARLMPVAAASGGVAAVAGLVAQEAVAAKGASHDVLVTHRNLNLALVLATSLLAAARRKRGEPSLAYLACGMGGLLVMSYTAYLGGKMVYQHGVGVEAAGGVREWGFAGNHPGLAASGGQGGPPARRSRPEARRAPRERRPARARTAPQVVIASAG